VVASADALPGDALYTLKRAVERTQLLLTGDPKARSDLEAEFTTRRIEEAQAVSTQGRQTRVEFTGWLAEMAGEHWTVSGLRVLVAAGTPISGAPAPGMWVHIAGVVRSDGVIAAERAAALAAQDVPLPTATPRPLLTATPGAAMPIGEDVEFIGVVQSIGAAAWVIEGQAVRVDAATEIRDNPRVGQLVEVRAERLADGGLLATRIRLENDGEGNGPAPTPEEDDDNENANGNSGPSPSNTPQPGDDDDDDDDNGNANDNSGPSPSNTPRPGEDDDEDQDNGNANDNSGPGGDDDDDDDDSGPGGGEGAATVTLAPAGADTPAPSETARPEDVEFEGTLEAVNGALWTVGGQAVEVTGETEIRDNPQVGDPVRVRALRYADGRMVATRIEAED
jgi:hypothetical protein